MNKMNGIYRNCRKLLIYNAWIDLEAVIQAHSWSSMLKHNAFFLNLDTWNDLANK